MLIPVSEPQLRTVVCLLLALRVSRRRICARAVVTRVGQQAACWACGPPCAGRDGSAESIVVTIRELESGDRKAWLELRSALWPGCTSEGEITEMHQYFSVGGALVTFLAADGDGILAGFIEASLRPAAEGCRTRPVAYIEGVYVAPALRRRGIARQLVAAVEKWAASHGCSEVASDCLAANAESIRFHQSVGFDIAKELIHFRREIPSPA